MAIHFDNVCIKSMSDDQIFLCIQTPTHAHETHGLGHAVRAGNYVDFEWPTVRIMSRYVLFDCDIGAESINSCHVPKSA